MSGLEYRIVWQRKGSRMGSRVFQRKGSARRWFEMLTGDPHWKCYHDGRGGDDPAYCLWTDLANRMDEEGLWRNDGTVTEPPPWEIEPRIEAREVGEWRCGAYGEDHSNGCPASSHYPLESQP